jgi:hypothetical protein
MYVVLDKKPGIGSIRDLNFEAVRPTTVELTNCSFGVVALVKAQPAAQACIDRKPLPTLYNCYLIQCSDKGCTEFIVNWTP